MSFNIVNTVVVANCPRQFKWRVASWSSTDRIADPPAGGQLSIKTEEKIEAANTVEDVWGLFIAFGRGTELCIISVPWTKDTDFRELVLTNRIKNKSLCAARMSLNNGPHTL